MVERLGQQAILIGFAEPGPFMEDGTDQLVGGQHGAKGRHAALHDASPRRVAVRVADPEAVRAPHHPHDVVLDVGEGDEYLAVG